MKNKNSTHVLRIPFGTIAAIFLSIAGFAQKKSLVDYVDNRIGVLDEYSNTVIGPQLPFASVSPSPQIKNGNDGYHPSEPVRGFGRLQESGTGWALKDHLHQ